MDEVTRQDSLTRAVRVLTVVLGCLTLVLLAQFLFYSVAMYRSFASYRGGMASSRFTTGPASSASGDAMTGASDGRSFDSLPPEQKIARAAAILLTKRQHVDGRDKAVVVEILKQAPGMTLPHRVGDEVGELARYGDDDKQMYGDGEVILYRDPSASSWESTTYRNGRITGLGGMPLDMFRALAAGKPVTVQTPSSASSPPSAFPSSAGGVPPGDIELQEWTSGGITRIFSIPRTAALRLPEWRPERGEPPLTAARAARLGTDAVRADAPGHPAFEARTISLQRVGCDEPIGDRWFYVISCAKIVDGAPAPDQHVPIVVLMDGTVVKGRIKS